MADSQVVVAERRHDGVWLRVSNVPRECVVRVERRVPHPGGEQWLEEDVRTAAGLETDAQSAPETAPPPQADTTAQVATVAGRKARSAPMRVLLAGAPGAGKGTQAALLADQLHVPHIASGDLVRQSIAAGTPAGLAVRDAVARGDLVPDDVIIRILWPTLVPAGSRGGYVLDGFPRTAAQAAAMDRVFGASGASVEVVVHLDVPDDVLRERLLARGREDDTAAVIDHRLEVYRSRTLPMLDWYAQREQMVVVEGNAAVDDVSAAVVRGVQERRLRRRLVS
jgi:adenylate kinase